jgi:branched-chain amino acid transport system substrate-binding protein
MMKMNKLMLTLGSLLLLAGCGSVTQTSSTDNTNTGDASETIKIGGNWDLSGAGAAYGGPANDGVKLAFKLANEAGGVNGQQIEYVEADNRTDANESANTAARLLDEENVQMIIGPATTGAFEAQIPIGTSAEIPMIAPAATGDSLTVDDEGNTLDYVFRVAFQDAFQGLALATFANGEGYETAAIIQDNSTDYGQNLSVTFKDAFEGEIVAEESYIAGDTDFNAILNNVAANDPDVIFIAGYYSEGGPIVGQAREMGIDSVILAPDGFGSQEFVDLAGAENVTDFYYTSHYTTGEGASEESAAFIEAYEAEYGVEPDMFAALGYDAANLAIDAMTRAESSDPAAVTAAIAETKDFAGVTGTFSFDDQHNPIKTAYIQEMQDGEVVGTTAISPEDIAAQ